MSTSCLRWVHYAGLDDAYLQVLMVIGFTAGTIGGTVLLWEARQRIRRFDLAVGAGIGVYNLLALMAVLISLKHVPGTVFFPLVGCGVVILDNVTAPLLWKEPISRAAEKNLHRDNNSATLRLGHRKISWLRLGRGIYLLLSWCWPKPIKVIRKLPRGD